MRSALLSGGCRDVTPDELAAIPAPPATRTWFPISHHDVYRTVVGTLEGSGFPVKEQRLTVAYDDHRFFATLDLSTLVSDDVGLCVGIANSTDKSLPARFLAGERVFLCSNLCYSAETVISRRHTKHVEHRFREAISDAVLSLTQYRAHAGERIGLLRQSKLTDDQADSIMLEAAMQNVVGWRQLPRLVNAYRFPTMPDFEPRTKWALLNAFTGLSKDRAVSYPAKVADETIRFQRLLLEDRRN